MTVAFVLLLKCLPPTYPFTRHLWRLGCCGRYDRVYSLIYDPQRSWRSWVLRTLANGVYMFGFIAMTPQLYINYR